MFRIGCIFLKHNYTFHYVVKIEDYVVWFMVEILLIDTIYIYIYIYMCMYISFVEHDWTHLYLIKTERYVNIKRVIILDNDGIYMDNWKIFYLINLRDITANTVRFCRRKQIWLRGIFDSINLCNWTNPVMNFEIPSFFYNFDIQFDDVV